MRRYAIIGSLLILGMALAGRAVSLAQKPPILAVFTGPADEPKLAEKVAPEALPNVPIVDEGLDLGPRLPTPRAPELDRQVANSTAVSTTAPHEAAEPNNLPTLELPTHATRPASLVLASGTDPMGSIETFLVRNRKEAEQSIALLNQEAEALRARLAKVEAARARWQQVADALDAREPAAGGWVRKATEARPSDELPVESPDAHPSRVHSNPMEGPSKQASEEKPLPPAEAPPVEAPPPAPPAEIPTSLPASTPPSEPARPKLLPVPDSETKPPTPLPEGPPLPIELPKSVEKTPENSPADFPALPEAKIPTLPPGELPSLPAIPR